MTAEKLSVEIKSRFDDRVLFTAELGTRYAERPYREKLGAVIVRALGEGANLRGANLRGACLRDADLRGANLRGATAIDAGQDIRGYRFVGIPYDDGIRIAAGCRWFTLAEAREHWAGDDRPSNAECRERVEMIARIARRRGWTIGDEQEAAS